jgi:hypothetical protein
MVGRGLSDHGDGEPLAVRRATNAAHRTADHIVHEQDRAEARIVCWRSSDLAIGEHPNSRLVII